MELTKSFVGTVNPNLPYHYYHIIITVNITYIMLQIF